MRPAARGQPAEHQRVTNAETGGPRLRAARQLLLSYLLLSYLLLGYLLLSYLLLCRLTICHHRLLPQPHQRPVTA